MSPYLESLVSAWVYHVWQGWRSSIDVTLFGFSTSTKRLDRYWISLNARWVRGCRDLSRFHNETIDIGVRNGGIGDSSDPAWVIVQRRIKGSFRFLRGTKVCSVLTARSSISARNRASNHVAVVMRVIVLNVLFVQNKPITCKRMNVASKESTRGI